MKTFLQNKLSNICNEKLFNNLVTNGYFYLYRNNFKQCKQIIEIEFILNLIYIEFIPEITSS